MGLSFRQEVQKAISVLHMYALSDDVVWYVYLQLMGFQELNWYLIDRLFDLLRTANEVNISPVFSPSSFDVWDENSTNGQDVQQWASVEAMRVLFRQQKYKEIIDLSRHLNLESLTAWELFWVAESMYKVGNLNFDLKSRVDMVHHLL